MEKCTRAEEHARRSCAPRQGLLPDGWASRFYNQLPQIRHHLVSFAKVNQTLVDLSQVVAKVLIEYFAKVLIEYFAKVLIKYFCQNSSHKGRVAIRCFCPYMNCEKGIERSDFCLYTYNFAHLSDNFTNIRPEECRLTCNTLLIQ